MIGYKGFDKNLCCKGFQFIEGGTYEYDGELKLCSTGFHFCKVPVDVLEYYPNKEGNKYAIIHAIGNIVTKKNKSVTNKIIIEKVVSYDELLNLCNGMFFNADINEERWYKNGILHRDDGPAFTFAGVQAWCQHGKLHRDNGPAKIFFNGSYQWYQHGKLHRDNDHAVFSDGSFFWYKNGQLHNDNDMPACMYKDGTKKWYENGVFIKSA